MTILAPIEPGEHIYVYQLQTKNNKFGEEVYIIINVVIYEAALVEGRQIS